jgi:Tol biopolymer transport system component
MGEVYRARDTRLGREVAVKILPEHLSSNPEFRERFDREAKAISALNHPHICTLYDVGHQDDLDYLVMEYVVGESLADRLHRGPLPLKETLKSAIEVCGALQTAHRAGIVHRDLKPGNIMLTKSGAKLMDFGLAKAAEAGDPGSGSAPLLSAARTMTGPGAGSPLTTAGALVGTIQYMSPEQVEGKPADSRSDVFALGAVIYEMVTGKRAFDGKNQISVASAILEKEPEPVSRLNPVAPANLEHAIARCLAKEPERRWQSVQDLGIELSWVAEGGASSSQQATAAVARKPSSARMAWLLSGLLAALMVAGGLWWWQSQPKAASQYFAAPFNFPARDIAIAPNGHTVAVVGYRDQAHKTGIFLYELGSQITRLLPDTEGASFPFWSPDGQSLGFFADGKLKRLEIAGGPVQMLCEAGTGRGGTWNKDGVILFTPTGALATGLWRVSASGGTPVQITFPDRNKGEDGHRWPMFLPDGKHYLFHVFNNTGRKDAAGVVVGELDSKETHFVVRSSANGAYAAPGYLLFYRDKTLYAQRFNLKNFQLEGEPAAILNDLQFSPRIQRATLASIDSGVLLAQSRSGAAVSQLTWFDRTGKNLGSIGEQEQIGNASISPDGRWIAMDKTDVSSNNTDLWVSDIEGKGMKRLTFDPSIDALPVWNPASNELAFLTNRELLFAIYQKSTNGSEPEVLLLTGTPDKHPNDWSRDGKYLIFEQGTDLWYLTFADTSTKEFLKGGSSALKDAHFSPDGKWVAYSSNESGKWEVYVTSFPEAKGRWQISSGGGEQPRWRGDGRELYFLSLDGKMMATPATTGSNFSAGSPVALFQANPRELIATSEHMVYDVSKDGQRFLINTVVRSEDTQPMTVVLNWSAKLNK